VIFLEGSGSAATGGACQQRQPGEGIEMIYQAGKLARKLLDHGNRPSGSGTMPTMLITAPQ